MNIKNQVLSIEQVRELKKLGFDVEKYASMCWLPPANEVNSFSPVNKQFWNAAELKYIPTLTIGDIMECLPEEIEENVLNIFAFGETWSVGWEGIQYCGSNTLIDALFETLKWCIKEKHILMINRKEEKPKLTYYLGEDMAH